MIMSGPKSYYEDYVRRRDNDRTLAKPPALLTDRNAYINFLEVQLERVSAACFAVQGYDERFNDMQGLIVALDQRCANTTRLISLAQQCTEVLYNSFEKCSLLTSSSIISQHRKYELNYTREQKLNPSHRGRTDLKKRKPWTLSLQELQTWKRHSIHSPVWKEE